MKKNVPRGESASALIDQRIKELGDWRGKTLASVRGLIKKADPEIVEEWKWMGTPVWSHNGIVCTGETHKTVFKMTFARGASLKDPSGLFNSSLDGSTRRAIDIREDERINEAALKRLIREAVALNLEGKKKQVGPREIPIPPDLAMALREEGVLEDWESMPPGMRAYTVKWIGQAVHETTRAKRVTEAVEEAHRRREKRVDRANPAR
jgi:hypothetical protein